MSLADDVAQFLLSPKDTQIAFAIAKLDFGMDSIRIDPEGYREMGRKIQSDGIHTKEYTPSKDTTVAEAYTSLLDSLSLGPSLKLVGDGASVMNQAGVIHEATHALVDYHGFQTTNAVEEAVAYIAQVAFTFYLGHVFSSPEPRSQAIMDGALDVVRGRNLTIKKGQRMSSGDKDIQPLLEAIRNHPAYPDADTQNHVNGIFGGTTNPKYPSATYGKNAK